MILSEKTLTKKTLYAGRILSLELQEVELPDGTRAPRELIRHAPAVGVLARRPDGAFVFVRQFRKAVERVMLEVVAGMPPQPLVLVMLGGRSGDRELVVAGVPQFKVGDEDIFFVQGNGRNFYPLYAVMHGKYPVRRDQTTGREYVTRSNGVPLTDVAQVALPMAAGPAAELQRRMSRTTDALSPAEFSRLIRKEREAMQHVE